MRSQAPCLKRTDIKVMHTEREQKHRQPFPSCYSNLELSVLSFHGDLELSCSLEFGSGCTEGGRVCSLGGKSQLDFDMQGDRNQFTASAVCWACIFTFRYPRETSPCCASCLSQLPMGPRVQGLFLCASVAVSRSLKLGISLHDGNWDHRTGTMTSDRGHFAESTWHATGQARVKVVLLTSSSRPLRVTESTVLV